MAKLLLINDNSSLPLNNINDVIAVYADDQKLGTKEQDQVNSGLFKLVNIVGKTVAEIQSDLSASHPIIKEMWYDSVAAEWRELSKRPKSLMRYENGIYSHNYNTIIGNTVVCNKTIIDSLKSAKSASVKG
jgi:Zn/Cd-binding protein ZinT